jgi:hypothetical protein
MFYCYGIDGVKYGPCDLETLRLWVSENRLTPETKLEDAQTGQEIVAGNVPGLFSTGLQTGVAPIAPGDLSPPMQMPYESAPGPQGQQSPYSTPPGNFAQNPFGEQGYYRRPEPVKQSNSITVAWVMLFLGLCVCNIMSIPAVIYGKKAKDEGHPQGGLVFGLSLALLALQILLFLVVMIILAISPETIS